MAIDDEIYDNREMLLSMLVHNGNVLRYVSSRLRDDEELVSIAINNNYDALKYASERLQLKFEKEFSMKKIYNILGRPRYINDFRAIPDFTLIKVAKKLGIEINSRPQIINSLLEHKHFTPYLIENHFNILDCGHSIQNYFKERVIDELERGASLNDVSRELRDDYDVVYTALSRNPDDIIYASRRLRDEFSSSLSQE